MLTVLRDKTRRFFEERRVAKEERETARRRLSLSREKLREEYMEEDRRRFKRLDASRKAELETMFLADPDANGHLHRAERTLVVVDMQPGFLSKYDEGERRILLAAVSEQIVGARSRGWPIIFVEYLPAVTFGETYPELLALVGGYEGRYDRRGKHDQSGAGEVIRSCGQRGFGRSEFQVCGVYADQCVARTVTDLALNNPSSLVYVVPSACRSWPQVAHTEQHYDWLLFPRCENIALVPAPSADSGHATPIAAHAQADTAPPAPQRQCP